MAKSVLWVALQEAKKQQLQTICEATIQKITSSAVIYQQDGETKTIPADLVILAQNWKSSSLATHLQHWPEELRQRVEIIGDAKAPGRITKQFALLSMLLSICQFASLLRKGDKIMNLAQLHYFRKLAQLEHYTQAAQELFISQPSLSASISSMEEELHIKLFQKKGRNVKLTKDGRENFTTMFAAP